MNIEEIDTELNDALSHVKIALNKSVNALLEDHSAKKEVGEKWEHFLGDFFRDVRQKGKENKINLLSLISFPKIR